MAISEKQIEEGFIKNLVDMKYVYRDDIHDRLSMEINFREKFQSLNKVHLTDSEFNRLLQEITTSDVFASAKRLRERNTFMREDGTPLQYMLVNIKDWCKNEYEVVNQLRINTRNSCQRYDVVILVNGLPLVQVELKKNDIVPHRAMQQIVDYKNDAGNGYENSLLCFMQMFIVSNQNSTYYFANNNPEFFNFNADESYLPVYQWTSRSQKKITDLNEFAEAFLPKCKLGEMINRYMVLVASERKILIMRPYQIYAVEAIVKCIDENRGNGFIWHTTGSGKTLTSFKAATLLKDNPDVDKCLFVVDRKDLDKQTREEFNKFQEGCVEENTNTDALVRRLLSEDYSNKIIVTTIQKLGIALDPKNKRNYQKQLYPIKNKRIIFIFDECHRSQFGENHKAIKDFFVNSQLFGFTGTPIFEANAVYTQVSGEEARYTTTEDIFEKQLHSYTITNAIDDKNVLRFHVDYYKLENVQKRNETSRKKAVVEAILDKHQQVTNSRMFNAIFATNSINDALQYYALFDSLQKEREKIDGSFVPLNVACVFSPPANGNKDIKQIQEDLPQERLDNEENPEEKKLALKKIIQEYNKRYSDEKNSVNYTIDEFDAYYQDVQQRIKNQKYSNKDYPHKNKIDIVIVVDMLLTGFDSKYLNTLYVDKNLKYHGLVQAFSRTNRILNATKPYGNILDFRGQTESVDAAIALFSGEKQSDARKIWLVEPFENIVQKYKKSVEFLRDFMNERELPFKASEIQNLRGGAQKSDFVNRFKDVQRYKIQLDQYSNIDDAQKEIVESLLSENELQAFRGAYLEIARQLKAEREQKPELVPPEITDLDFEFVLFASALIDYDYIMTLIGQYVKKSAKIKLTKEQLVSLIRSSANLMDDRDDIIAYIDSLDGVNGMTEQEVRDGYEHFRNEKKASELKRISEKYSLNLDDVQKFVDDVVNRKIFDGDKLSELLESLDLGWKARVNMETELAIDLAPLLRKMVPGQDISGLSAYEKRN